VSAFVVSKAHIDALVSVAVYGPKDCEGQWRGFNWAKHDPRKVDWSDQAWTQVSRDGLAQLRKAENEITGDELGFILWAENVASVHYRYPGEDVDTLPGTYAADGRHEVSHGYTFSRLGKLPTAVEAFSLIACLDYQSCEHPEWIDSEAYRILDQLKEALIRHLPGYSAAPWEWNEVTA
jgi:hypothetical protein